MGGRRKILLVDDDAAADSDLAARLAKCYDVVAAKDARETIALARKEHPHVILCDTAVTHALSSEPGIAAIPRVCLSESGDVSRRAHLSELVQAIDKATGR